MELEYEEYPAKMKAAVLLACLGPDIAGKILSSLSEDEVEQVTLDISSLGAIDPELRMRVMCNSISPTKRTHHSWQRRNNRIVSAQHNVILELCS